MSLVVFLAAAFLVKLSHATSDVRSGVPLHSTAEPDLYHDKDPRHMNQNDNDDDFRDSKPAYTAPTEYTYTSATPTKPQRHKYMIDYQEASRRGKSEVTIQLLSKITINGQLQVMIEYSKKVRRVRKTWGGKAKVSGSTVVFTTDVIEGIKFTSFGYTIDYRGRQAHQSNYPVFMDVSCYDDPTASLSNCPTATNY